MLVSTKDILNDAYQKRYAVAAFNVYSLETLHAAVNTAEKEQSPVIIALGERYFDKIDVEAFSEAAKSLAKKSNVPISLHLDHAYEKASVIRAIQNGFTSVMFDGSKHPLDENIRLTKEVTEIAHMVDVSVEGEIGSMKRGAFSDEEAGDGTLTDPESAKDFVKETQVDFLAAAIGTAHGMYKGEPNIDLELLERIRDAVDMPLVLHGGSGNPEDKILGTINRGVSKINVNTEISLAAVKELQESLNNMDQYPHLSTLMADMRQTMETSMAKFVNLYKNQ